MKKDAAYHREMRAVRKKTVFAIRCFLNGKRCLTKGLTKREAMIFRRVALTLAYYLTKTYKLDEGRARTRTY